jgi:hypothetical protein
MDKRWLQFKTTDCFNGVEYMSYNGWAHAYTPHVCNDRMNSVAFYVSLYEMKNKDILERAEGYTMPRTLYNTLCERVNKLIDKREPLYSDLKPCNMTVEQIAGEIKKHLDKLSVLQKALEENIHVAPFS